MRCWTRYEPMKPAPPVMHTRFPVMDIDAILLSVVTVVRSNQICRLPPGHRFLTQREQLFARHAIADQPRQRLSRALQGCDDHQIVRDLDVPADRQHRHAEELVAALDVENRERLETELL